MDQLQQLVVILRVSARTSEPNRVALVEEAIDECLKDKAGIAAGFHLNGFGTPSSAKKLTGVHSRTGA